MIIDKLVVFLQLIFHISLRLISMFVLFILALMQMNK